jgi:hypothetical protein
MAGRLKWTARRDALRTNPGFVNISVADPDVADVNPLTDRSRHSAS